jgi:hypothetical protein
MAAKKVNRLNRKTHVDLEEMRSDGVTNQLPSASDRN